MLLPGGSVAGPGPGLAAVCGEGGDTVASVVSVSTQDTRGHVSTSAGDTETSGHCI